MSGFKIRRIRNKSHHYKWRNVKKALFRNASSSASFSFDNRKYIVGFALIVIAAGIVFKTMTGLYAFVTNFDPKSIVFAAAAELEADENNYVNLVLLGDGGHVRDGADLIDTIIVVSIDQQKKTTSLLSIPRDYYVRSEEYGRGKINEFYRKYKNTYGEDKAYSIYPKVLGEMFNMEIPYYARIDFDAFVEIIDSIGGIEVNVENSIYDPFYPNDNDNGYTVFNIKEGVQKLDGELALKFVRSRKTTSDFDRAARQQQVLMAIKNKALSSNILTDPSTITSLYNAIQSNLNTNLTIREMIAMAEFAKDFNKDQMVRKVLHDDPSQDGGFLYTPQRKFYNNQFVLVPDGDNLTRLQRYAEMIFHFREIYMDPVNVTVLNGSKRPGLAREVASQLNRHGLNIIEIDNLFDDEGERKTVDHSYVQYHQWSLDEEKRAVPGRANVVEVLKKFIDTKYLPIDTPRDEDPVHITIVIGNDFKLDLF